MANKKTNFFQKLMVIVLLLLGLSTINNNKYIKVNSETSNIKFSITANSNKQIDINEMYLIKKEVFDIFEQLAKGMNSNDYAMIIKDNIILFKINQRIEAIFQNNQLIIKVNNAKGKTISGELIMNDNCNKEIIETRFFLTELFKK